MAKNKKKKVVAKKKSTKKKTKVSSKKVVSQELVIRVQQPTESQLPTVKVLEPMTADGKKKMALVQTWVSAAQLIKIVQKTPPEHIYKRPGKGGKEFTYVTGNYVEKVLNFVFGWNWDFEILEHGKEGNQVWVKGKLTIKSPKGETITKSQFGRADIKMLTKGGMVDFGNDLKAASTDALKKCASLLGIASDIYGKQEYKQEANIDIREEPIVAHDESQEIPDGEKVVGPEGTPVIPCRVCGDPVTEQEAKFSQKVYGKHLCREHQKSAKRK